MRSEKLQTMKQTLKMAYEMDRQAVILTIISSLLCAIRPYVGIVTSACVLDQLTAGVDYKQVIGTALIGVTLIGVMTIVEGFVSKKKSVRVNVGVKRFDMERSKKTLVMDYEQLESPMAQEIRNRIKNDNNWGAGFNSVFWQLAYVLDGLFESVIGLIILIPLFQNTAFFVNEAVVALVVGFMIMIPIVGLFNIRYVNQKMAQILEEYTGLKVYFGYFLWQGGLDYKAGKEVRIYGVKRLIQKYLVNEEQAEKKQIKKASRIQGIGECSQAISTGILQGGAYILVVMRAASGALSVGDVVKYATTIFTFTKSLLDVMNGLSQFLLTAQRQQSTLEYIDMPSVLYKGTLPVEKRDDHDYEIEFRGVSFKYPGSEDYVLKDLSLKFCKGKKLAVVGMNGSGKTTMIKLLCRLYDPTEGSILLNGIDIRKYDYNEYMGIFSVVFQDFKLFSFSIGQNVATDRTYDEERVVECIEKVGFKQRFKSMPQGIETPLYSDYAENGVEISGGEAQKLALARALYKDAPFIILDEPTAALDPVAEFEIYTRFNEIAGDKTTIYISHRLASCRFCDDIAVFHEGRLIQRGSHEVLVADTQNKYYELWQAQAQYYVEEPA
ncbi:MAG: ABC transporter ATP-binding protein [Cellulosilyticaceae bacterium]